MIWIDIDIHWYCILISSGESSPHGLVSGLGTLRKMGGLVSDSPWAMHKGVELVAELSSGSPCQATFRSLHSPPDFL